MRLELVFAAAAMMLTGVSFAESEQESVKVMMGWRISLDENGRVTDIKADRDASNDRVPQIRQRMEAAARTWQFVPGSLNGKPAPTETHLSISASLIAVDSNSIRIRVDHAGTGPWFGSLVVPRYPVSAIDSHHQGKVIVKIDYDENGKATSASLDDASEHIDNSIVEASLTAAKRMRYQPERVAGHGVPGALLSPFCFTLGAARSDGCKWKTVGKHDSLEEGTAFALNPATKIETAVDGKFL